MSDLPALSRQNKKDEIVRRLQNGADINERNEYGQTALYWACFCNFTEIVEILLQNNEINVNLKSNGENSPFSWACANYQYASALLMLRDTRVDVDLDDKKGWSPFMYACYYGNTKIVQLLLSYGRNIDVYKKTTKDGYDYYGIKFGSTPLDVAKQRNRADIVQLLQQYQNNPKETQKTLRNQLNLNGKK